MKLCEETNQLIKEMLTQTTEQTHLLKDLFNFPHELKKTTDKLSHVVHMVCRDYLLLPLFQFFLSFQQAKVSQARQQNDDEDITLVSENFRQEIMLNCPLLCFVKLMSHKIFKSAVSFFTKRIFTTVIIFFSAFRN
jgi:hypothetical protein